MLGKTYLIYWFDLSLGIGAFDLCTWLEKNSAFMFVGGKQLLQMTTQCFKKIL